MSILSTERIGHAYDDRWLFKDLNFGIQRGDRIALVGINGTGKSTLLGVLAGHIDPLEGKVVSEKGITIGHLAQEPDYKDYITINDFISASENQQQKLILEYEKLADDPNADKNLLAKVIEQINELNAWEFESNIKIILTRLGIDDFSQKIETLSGGQKKRLNLAKLLMDDPDVYILDEPTNHLDIQTIEWLEKLLTTGQKTVLLVSHDRYFLDNVCTEIREIDRGKVLTYRGNYAYFLEKKNELAAEDEIAYAKNKSLWKKELEWMRRQPQARGTKSKSRINSFHDLDAKVKDTNKNESLTLSVKTTRIGNKIIELDRVSKQFGDNLVIDNFSYTFKKGDRIGVAGINGSGKSTFLNLLAGTLQPDRGAIALGETLVVGYYKQGGLDFKNEERVIDVVKNVAEHITMADGSVLTASQLLTHFLFPPAKQHGLVHNLSGGEKKRLQLMRVLMSNPNVLILDEPTNDLDIDTLNVLEDFLLAFPGVLILVSHDRYLLDILTEQLFIFEGEGFIRIYNGNYADYKEEEVIKAKKPVVPQTPKPVQNKKKKISYQDQREYESINSEIDKIENEIREKTAAMNNTEAHHELATLAEDIELLTSQLDEKSERWLVLAELIEN